MKECNCNNYQGNSLLKENKNKNKTNYLLFILIIIGLFIIYNQCN